MPLSREAYWNDLPIKNIRHTKYFSCGLRQETEEMTRREFTLNHCSSNHYLSISPCAFHNFSTALTTSTGSRAFGSTLIVARKNKHPTKRKIWTLYNWFRRRIKQTNGFSSLARSEISRNLFRRRSSSLTKTSRLLMFVPTIGQT